MSKIKAQQCDVFVSAPFGGVGLTMQNDCVVGIDLLCNSPSSHPIYDPLPQNVAHQIQQYFLQKNFKLDIPYAASGTSFQKRVWKVISQIPYGHVMTYSELAKKVNSGPRAVANACGANPLPLLIPCHRVIAKNGLGGFMQGLEGGLKIKGWLLANESK
jgi:methylated-DNA-[protein]-cysteine S-methyltransferase